MVVATRIVTLSKESTVPIQGTAYNLIHFAIDFASACKNIKETSFNEADKHIRCKKWSDESGVYYHKIKELTE